MSVTAESEAPRRLEGAQSEAVTIAFGDPEAGVYGVARVGLSLAEGQRVASGLGILFCDGELASVRAEGGLPLGSEGWAGAQAGGVSTKVVEPLARWTARFTSEDGRYGFDIELEARSAPAELTADHPAAKAGGMEGYEQLCAVTGTATVDGAQRPLDCAGQRGHSWGAPDWEKLSLARTVGAWLEGDAGLSLTAVRPAKGASRADEATAAFLYSPGTDGGSVAVADPRLSTTYDADGRQRHAGLELFVGADDEWAHRAAGEVVCGTTLDLGRLRLDCAFFKWRMDGREGVGRYDLLRRVEA